MTNITTRAAVVASVAALSLGAAAIATAATNSDSSSSGSGSTTTTTTKHPRPKETLLTGDVADKVKAAALAKLPGATVLRTETDEGGVYEAHVRKSDGTYATVHVDKDYDVTSVDTDAGPGGHGGRHGGGPRGIDAAALATALGVTEAKLTSALDTARSAVDESGSTDPATRDAALATALADALGLDAAKVKTALAAQRPTDGGPGGRRGGHGGRGDCDKAASGSSTPDTSTDDTSSSDT